MNPFDLMGYFFLHFAKMPKMGIALTFPRRVIILSIIQEGNNKNHLNILGLE
tara:strand:+ start:39 stop:194 length:156 start_codon:yes stop_codon:yes gene_type:complete